MYQDIHKIEVQVQDYLEKKNLSPNRMAMELQRLENLHKQTKKGTAEHRDILKKLYIRYKMLNRILGLICKKLNYPARQDQWLNIRPLEVMQEIFKGIEMTEWYGKQQKLTVEWTDHPWYAIILK